VVSFDSAKKNHTTIRKDFLNFSFVVFVSV